MKYMMAAALVAMTVSLVGCSKDKEETKTDTPATPVTPTPQRPEGDIAIRYGAADGAYVYPGDTVVYNTTDEDMNMLQMASVNLFIDNQTQNDLVVRHMYEKLQGPADLETEICANGLCPWNLRSTYTLTPGVDPEKPFTLKAHLHAEYSGQQILYKLVTGKGSDMADPVTVYVQVNVR